MATSKKRVMKDEPDARGSAKKKKKVSGGAAKRPIERLNKGDLVMVKGVEDTHVALEWPARYISGKPGGIEVRQRRLI